MTTNDNKMEDDVKDPINSNDTTTSEGLDPNAKMQLAKKISQKVFGDASFGLKILERMEKLGDSTLLEVNKTADDFLKLLFKIADDDDEEAPAKKKRKKAVLSGTRTLCGIEHANNPILVLEFRQQLRRAVEQDKENPADEEMLGRKEKYAFSCMMEKVKASKDPQAIVDAVQGAASFCSSLKKMQAFAMFIQGLAVESLIEDHGQTLSDAARLLALTKGAASKYRMVYNIYSQLPKLFDLHLSASTIVAEHDTLFTMCTEDAKLCSYLKSQSRAVTFSLRGEFPGLENKAETVHPVQEDNNIYILRHSIVGTEDLVNALIENHIDDDGKDKGRIPGSK